MYRTLLTRAWHLTIRERRLWIFALFASVVVGSGFGTAILLTLGADVSQSAFGFVAPTPELRTQIATVWHQAQVTGTGAVIATLGYGAFLLALLLAFIWLTAVGLNAIVLATQTIARGDPIPKRLWANARMSFWSACAVHVLAKAATAIVLSAWASVLTSSALTSTSLASFTAIIGFIISALFLTVIHFLTPLAISFIVLERRGPGSALREAGALLRTHWLTITEASLLLSIIHVGSIIAFSIIAFLISLPFIFIGSIGFTRGIGWLVAGAVTGRAAALALLLLFTLAISTTYLATSWTLLWLRLTAPGDTPEPWVIRRSRQRERRN